MCVRDTSLKDGVKSIYICVCARHIVKKTELKAYIYVCVRGTSLKVGVKSIYVCVGETH